MQLISLNSPCTDAGLTSVIGKKSMANPAQLYLLADHIKLSLLERQRAISLSLEPTSQDGHISRSLDSMREGLEALEEEQGRLTHSGDLYVS